MMFVSCHKQCCNKILFLPWCLFTHIRMFLWEGTLINQILLSCTHPFPGWQAWFICPGTEREMLDA